MMMKKLKLVIPILLLISYFPFNSYAESVCKSNWIQATLEDFKKGKCDPYGNDGYCIRAGSKKFTYYAIANDLKEIVAPFTGIRLTPLEGGSVGNVASMRCETGVKFAIVQADVLEYYTGDYASKVSRTKSEKDDVKKLIKPLRVILPLHDETVHVFVRVDSSINSLSDLKGKIIALGEETGGTALTGRSLYRYMFDEDLIDVSDYIKNGLDVDAKSNTKGKVFYSSREDALRALTIDKTVDAWAMVVGQSSKRFTEEMTEDAKKYIKLVKYNKNIEIEGRIIKNGPYDVGEIKATNYSWNDQNIPTINVRAFLISQKYKNLHTKKYIQKFTFSLCQKIAKLKIYGDPAWKDINMNEKALPKGGGWKYSEDAKKAFEECNSPL